MLKRKEIIGGIDMSWMSEVPTVSFLWLDGYTYSVKDVKTLPVYDKFVKISLKKDDCLDEIASRTEVFGQDEESSAYLIFEANVEKIVENDFNLNAFHEIKIPVVT